MALAKKNKDFDIMSIVMAAGGGVASGVIQTVLEDNVGFIQDNPKMTPVVMGAISAAGLYFVDAKYNPLFYGMIGAAAGQFGEALIDNVSGQKSINKQMVIDAPPVLQLPDYAENLENPGFEISNVMDMFESDFV